MNFRNAFWNLTLPDGKIIPNAAWEGRGQQSSLTEYFGEAVTLFLQHIWFATDLQWRFHSMASWCYTANMRHDIKCKIGRKTCNCLQMGYISMYNHTKSVLPGLWLAFQTLWCFDFFFPIARWFLLPNCIYMYCVLVWPARQPLLVVRIEHIFHCSAKGMILHSGYCLMNKG